ncbi:hypothetical protein, partial [Dokdonella sp.]|uniref:hypothetical protein n=1 Tax=Dokdonella sp. TaxID=2291710 RepID=UPI0026232A06
MRSRLKAAIALAMLGGGLIASSFALAGTSKGEARAAELEAIQTDLATRNPISPNAAALPPLALYSNVGTDAGAFLLNGGVSTSGTTRYTSMVCNRVTLGQPGSQLITGFSFAIHNENAAAFTPSQVSIQFYDDSGANGGPGTRLLNRSGLYIGGGSFSGVNMPVCASVWTGLPSGYTAAYVPAQTTTQVPRVWACLYFGGTSAQVAQLANLGMQKYANAPTAGSTEDLAFVSTVGALNPPSNPAGTLVTGSGAANVFGWELTTLGTNTLLDSYQIVDATGAVANPVRPINTAAAGVERNFSGYAATISVPPAPAGTWNATGLVLYATCPTVGNFSNVQAKVQFWDPFNGSTAADVFANSSPLASATLDLGPVNCTSTTAINTFAARLPTPAPLGRGGKLGITVGYAADSGSGLVNGAFMEVLATTTTTNPFPAVGTNASTGATGWYKSASNRADLNFTGTTDYVSVANQHLAVRVFADMAAPTRTVTVGTDGPGSGTVTPGTGNVYEGLSATYTLTPAAGNHLVTVVGNCPGTLSGSRYVVGPVTGDCSFKAVYAPGVATNGLYRSPTMNHTLLANSDGSTLNVVSAAWDDTGPSSGNWDLNFWASSGALRVWTVSTYADKLVGSPFSLLSSGGVVNSSSTFSTTGATITPAAAWLAGADGYFGFQFVCNGRLANPVASPG